MLRPLDQTDCQAICDINDQALGHKVSLELTKSQLEKLRSDKHHYLLGYADAKTNLLLGYLHAECYESLYSEKGFNILALAVRSDHQGRGIGRRLLAALEKKARQEKASFIRLNSASHRTEAHAFYRKLSYVDDKTQLRFMKLL